MPVATPEAYAEMLDQAKRGAFAYPAINVSSTQTLNAAFAGLCEAESDGIIQISTGGASYLSGSLNNMVTGAASFAAFAHEAATKYPITVAFHTDHCPPTKLATYVRPLLKLSTERVGQGLQPLFQSHMWDGSAIPLDENLAVAKELLDLCRAAKVILELEIGVVGGEEDGIVGAIDDKLYTTNEDMIETLNELGAGERGRYLLAATFGNVHGVYKPGNVRLRPSILQEGQRAAAKQLGLPEDAKPFDFVFHGGSGSSVKQIREAIDYGVVKMNVDTDTQYAFTRPIVDHMFKNYDAVLRIDGEVGDKKAYDPRSYGKLAEEGMTARIVHACTDLRSTGRSISR